MKIITAGSRYLDIDAYAGIVAYAELLQKQGIPAQAASTASLNESVSETVRAWPVSLETQYIASPNDTYTLIDISTPEHFDSLVDHSRIDAVIDHHPGFEAYWQEKIGNNANIEPIGAACTQVFEYWQKAGLVSKMSITSARLLVCGILDNTLNFGAKISTQRDKDAYQQLMSQANLPTDWAAQYFGEIQVAIDKDPVAAIQKDTKSVQFPSHKGPIHVGQFAVWDATKVLDLYQDALRAAFDAGHQAWFINVISIGEGKSYLICGDTALQKWLAKLLIVEFNGSLAIADRLWLRKEIIKQDIS